MNWRVPASPLTGGVSRQPVPSRDPNQMQSADNVSLFIQRGLEKRHGTTYVNSGETSEGYLNITGTATDRWYTHFIDRSPTEQFVMFVDDQQATQANQLQVFNLAGEKQTVTIESTPVLAALALDLTDTAVLIDASDAIVVEPYVYDYLETGDAVTYSDGGGTAPTGLVDTTVYYVIKTTIANQIQLASSQANALAGTEITLSAGSVAGTNHSLSTSIPKTIAYLRYGTGEARDKLRVLTVGTTTFIVNKQAPTYLTGTAPTYANITAQASMRFPNDGGSYTDTQWDVGDYINLVSAEVGYPVGVYEIIAALHTSADQDGPWYSRVPPSAEGNEIEEGSFPIRLVYDEDAGDFTLDVINWTQRLSGDAITNPGPEFIGYPIKDIAVSEDRLWFGAGPYVFASQAGDLYNLWVDDWTNIVDSDPIDLPLAAEDIHTAEFLVPFAKTLVVFTDGGQQFEIKSNNAFTPKDTNLIPTSQERISNKAYPVKMGQQLYFASDQGDFSYVWEYFYNYDYDSNIAVNAALHIERYLPENLDRFEVSENNGILFCSSIDEPSSIYCLFTYWNITQKIQNAWSRWTYDSDFSIYGYKAVGNRLYMVFSDGTDIWLEYQPIATPDAESDANGSLNSRLHMDRKQSLTGVYNSTTKKTTFTLPFLDADMDTVVLGAGFGNKKGIQVTATTGSAGGVTTLEISGNYSAYTCFVGKSYNMDCELSRVYPKDSQGQTIFGSLQLFYLDMYVRDTTTVDVKVTPPGRSTRTTRFIANRTGSAVFGQTGLAETARKRVHIRGRGADTQIRLFNDTPFQSEITHIEFMGDLQGGAYQPTAVGG